FSTPKHTSCRLGAPFTPACQPYSEDLSYTQTRLLSAVTQVPSMLSMSGCVVSETGSTSVQTTDPKVRLSCWPMAGSPGSPGVAGGGGSAGMAAVLVTFVAVTVPGRL